MFDPKAFLDAAISKLKSGNKEQIVREMLEMVANFVDKHDLVVPDLHVKVGIVDISLTAKKVEDQDASAKIKEQESAKKTDEIDTDPMMKVPVGQ
jgi:hypothetical protein